MSDLYVYDFDMNEYGTSYSIGLFSSVDKVNEYIKEMLGENFPVKFENENQEILYEQGIKQIFFGITKRKVDSGFYDYIIKGIIKKDF